MGSTSWHGPYCKLRNIAHIALRHNYAELHSVYALGELPAVAGRLEGGDGA